MGAAAHAVAAIVFSIALMGVARYSGAQPPSSEDKTGTNPLNLQHAVSLSNDFASLPDGLYINRTVYRWTVPVAARRGAVTLELPLATGNVTGRTEMAFADVAASAVWTPWLGPRFGLLAGIDTTWNTATNEALGSGRHTVAPFARGVFTPSPKTVLGVRYAHQRSVGDGLGPDINQGRIGVSALWLPTPLMWIAVEPEGILDIEREHKSGAVALEHGRLLMGGLSTLLRTRIGIGAVSARPFDWTVEFGFRIIP